MKIGDLEITAALDRNGTPYSSQEDIFLRVTFKNLSDARAIIPYLKEHPARYHLKDKGRKTERKSDYAPPASLGTPAPDPHPEAVADPGEPVLYSLLVQFPLGFLAEGDYSLQYSFDFPGLPFTSDWLDFKVLALKVGEVSYIESAPGACERLHMAWSDTAAKPQRILFQRSYVGPARPLAPRTLVAGEGEDVTTPVASTSSPGIDPLTAWVGWVSKDKLGLSRITGNDKVKATAFPIPVPAQWSLLPSLHFSEAPGGKDPVLAGMLLGRDAKKKLMVSGFLLASASGPVWMPPVTLPGGVVLAAELIPLSPHRHFALWVRRDGMTLKVEAFDWQDTQAPGPVRVLGEVIPADDEIYQGMDAMPVDGLVIWTLLFLKKGSGGNPNGLRRVGHGFDPQRYKTTAGAPRSVLVDGRPGPVETGIRFDGDGVPWIWQRDVQGFWAQSPDMSDAVGVQSPHGVFPKGLIFRNRNVPKFLWLNPEAGFESVAVPLADAEEEDEDELVGTEEG
jgi:hypothetical protein